IKKVILLTLAENIRGEKVGNLFLNYLSINIVLTSSAIASQQACFCFITLFTRWFDNPFNQWFN
ncbi:MAG: hypothetical protein L0J44_03370, partial [Tetragenococcus koreensis]|nr:hypothetical protein [Tetragenococcus koreensis]